MNQRIAIIDGTRTPMGRYGGALSKVQADDLSAHTIKELLNRSKLDKNDIDQVIIGNVAQPSHAANIARVAALKGGVPKHVPAFTVHRNCASGMEAISNSISKILSGEGKVYLAGGTESMSNIPLLFNNSFKGFMENLGKSRSIGQKLGAIAKFRPHMLSPRVGLKEGLTDITCNMIMGDTAEILAKEFGISRDEQDKFAARSHNLAEKARNNGIFAEEITPIITNMAKAKVMEHDEGIRDGQTIEKLAKLRPYFDRKNGTVTAGNSSQITDGAASMILMSEAEAKQRKLKPIGYIKGYAYAGLDPHRMGLGPVFALAKVMKQTKTKLSDYSLIEINEAFASQVIGCVKAAESSQFCKNELGLDKAIGSINESILNVNGGAIALGHPVGMTGARIVLHTLNELRRRKKNMGLASLCVGGGQGAAFVLEVA